MVNKTTKTKFRFVNCAIIGSILGGVLGYFFITPLGKLKDGNIGIGPLGSFVPIHPDSSNLGSKLIVGFRQFFQ